MTVVLAAAALTCLAAAPNHLLLWLHQLPESVGTMYLPFRSLFDVAAASSLLLIAPEKAVCVVAALAVRPPFAVAFFTAVIPAVCGCLVPRLSPTTAPSAPALAITA